MLRAFLRTPSGAFGLAGVLVLFLVAIVAPALVGELATEVHIDEALENPTPSHLLGTDHLGRDIFARLLVATGVSLSVSLAAASLGALIGVPLGVIATFLPPSARALALRTIDAMIAFPGILVAIIVIAIVGPGVVASVLGVGVFLSFSFARISSTLAMSVAGRDYVAAARILGIGPSRLLVRHISPNIADTLVITLAVRVSSAILEISSLSFLGLGVQPPQFDWGRMLTEGVRTFYLTPWAALGPAAAIAASALAFGFAGEALARSMNPMLRQGGRPARTDAHKGATPLSRGSIADTRLGETDGEDSPVLAVSDLTVTFPGPRGPVTVVNRVSFAVHAGEALGIVGESGSGKTMTAMAIARLVPHPGIVSGVVKFLGRDLAHVRPDELDGILGTRVAVVFQDPMASLNPALKVSVQLTEAARFHRNLSRRQAETVAITRLGEVNLPMPKEQLQRHPHELSGGMRQRVMIAMGLMNDPALIIADEPTTALDVTIQAQIMDLLLRSSANHGAGLILISHNLGLVSQNCDRVVVMYAGSVVEELSKDDVQRPLHPYTKALLGAVLEVDRDREEPLISIAGQPPDPAELPAGCPFAPRCPLVRSECWTEMPPLILRPDGRKVACWVENQGI